MLRKQLEEDKRKVEIISTVPLSKEQLNRIKQLIQEKFGNDLVAINKVQKNIIGGLIIRFGDIVIDQSLRTRLDRIEKELYGY